jgi:tetratricopeptide (TPR) repeat protein
VAHLPVSDFWAFQARCALVRVLARRGEDDEGLSLVRKTLRASPATCDRIREVLFDEADRLRNGGFCERALSYCEASVAGGPEPLLRWNAVLRLAADCCVVLRRYPEARRHLETVRSLYPSGTDRYILARHEIATVLTLEGRLDRAVAVLEKELRAKRGPSVELPLLFALAVARGGEESPRAALSVLDRAARLGVSGESAVTLATYRALFLCGAGKPGEAASVLERARRVTPGLRAFSPIVAYVPPAVARRWRPASRILVGAARDESLPLWERAFLLLLGGVVSELGGDATGAQSAWEHVERRFPPERVHYLSRVAAALREGGGEPGLLQGLPYDVYHRCELFYWAGLLFERRRNPSLSKRLLGLAASEDPTFRWPTRLARKRLGFRGHKT